MRRIGLNAIDSATIKGMVVPDRLKTLIEERVIKFDMLKEDIGSKLQIAANQILILPDVAELTRGHIPYRVNYTAMFVPASVRTISYRCFRKAESLHYLIFDVGSQLESIAPRVFYRTHIKQIVLPSQISWPESIDKRLAKYKKLTYDFDVSNNADGE